jgi:hypothetical protein
MLGVSALGEIALGETPPPAPQKPAGSGPLDMPVIEIGFGNSERRVEMASY